MQVYDGHDDCCAIASEGRYYVTIPADEARERRSTFVIPRPVDVDEEGGSR